MRRASIVLGLGFGDEGKGATVNSLIPHSKMMKSIVIRFSGGQQAAHNVIHDGVHHTFASYGSGTLKGIPTYISEHCTIDPLCILKEANILAEKQDFTPSLLIHPLAKVTTPYDVYANRASSKIMGDGTCGMGICTTMKRNEGPVKLHAIDLLNPKVCRTKLLAIANYYHENAFSANIDMFIDILDKIKFRIVSYDVLKHYNKLIFEGSQGIMLDMDHGFYPHVTYANTTSKNALEICKNIGVDFTNELEIYYVTRAYQTRHGNGPLSNEIITKDVQFNLEKEHNKLNYYQGEFRVGDIDIDLINHAVNIDNIYSQDITKHMIVTCMDQMPEGTKLLRELDGLDVSYFNSFIYRYNPEHTDEKSHIVSASGSMLD